MNYRRLFHLSPAQLAECDLRDVLADLEMLGLEEEYRRPPEEIEVAGEVSKL